ncbi:MAG: hypothetical protein HY401_09070 [Elusimicrobia bacterium]|nr:hypothetical protein [Elusimicrobiota bacterium]
MPVTNVLTATAAWLAFLHALAPDHWVPFVALARTNSWSRSKLALVTFLAGLGHVGTSLVLGLAGILLGQELSRLQGVEARRGEMAILLLIGFGIAYLAWGIKHARHGVNHHHVGVDSLAGAAKTAFLTRFWIFFAVMIFGPCEPMIPLIFLAWAKGLQPLLSVVGVFSFITVTMVVAQSLLAYQGLSFFWSRHEDQLARYSHAIAGATIIAVGLLVILFDL